MAGYYAVLAVLLFSDELSSFLQITRPTIKARMSLNLGKIPSLTSELAPLERQKKLMNNVVTTLAPSFLIGSSSFLQATRITIKARMSLNLGKIPSLTSKLFRVLNQINSVVTTLAPSFLIGSSSFLQATRIPIISLMGSKFSRIRPGTYELPGKIPIDL